MNRRHRIARLERRVAALPEQPAFDRAALAADFREWPAFLVRPEGWDQHAIYKPARTCDAETVARVQREMAAIADRIERDQSICNTEQARELMPAEAQRGVHYLLFALSRFGAIDGDSVWPLPVIGKPFRDAGVEMTIPISPDGGRELVAVVIADLADCELTPACTAFLKSLVGQSARVVFADDEIERVYTHNEGDHYVAADILLTDGRSVAAELRRVLETT